MCRCDPNLPEDDCGGREMARQPHPHSSREFTQEGNRVRTSRAKAEETPVFNRSEQRFKWTVETLPRLDVPLTVTLQLTRACNLNCVYCSECHPIPNMPLDQLRLVMDRLDGVSRIIIAGGEPLLREDISNVLSICRERFSTVALATNATLVTPSLADTLAQYLDYADVTFDGTRLIHDRVRGKYDHVLSGTWCLRSAGIELSIVMVVMRASVQSVPYVAQLADALGAKKLKLLSPIPKGRGVDVLDQQLSSKELMRLRDRTGQIKSANGWIVRITISDWSRIREGHAIIVQPDGSVVASPVWSQPECVLKLGSLRESSIRELWKIYPYADHHIAKYTEQSLLVC